jgi:hypothetical protein
MSSANDVPAPDIPPLYGSGFPVSTDNRLGELTPSEPPLAAPIRAEPFRRARIALTLRSAFLALTALPAGQCLVVAGAEAWSTKCGRADALTRRIGICAIRRARIGRSIGKALSAIDRGIRTRRSGSDGTKQQ